MRKTQIVLAGLLIVAFSLSGAAAQGLASADLVDGTCTGQYQSGPDYAYCVGLWEDSNYACIGVYDDWDDHCVGHEITRPSALAMAGNSPSVVMTLQGGTCTGQYQAGPDYAYCVGLWQDGDYMCAGVYDDWDDHCVGAELGGGCCATTLQWTPTALATSPEEMENGTCTGQYQAGPDYAYCVGVWNDGDYYCVGVYDDWDDHCIGYEFWLCCDGEPLVMRTAGG